MTRRILITGGFGYVGGRVAQKLASLPNTEVILGSRIPHPSPTWLPAASVILTDWSSQSKLHDACNNVDTILHLAAMNEIDAVKDPVGALEMTAVYTARLVEAARDKAIKRFIYLSTAHVYGSPLIGKIDESICPHPIHPYATSHRAAEDVVLAARERYDQQTFVLRLSNSFGRPAYPDVNRWSLLVNDLCRQAVTTGELVLRTDGLQRRDFITLNDVANSIVHIMNLSNEMAGDGVFNIGGGWAPTIYEMAMLIAERCEITLGFKPEIKRPKPLGDECSFKLDYSIEKLTCTGFILESNHESEIDATLNLCRDAFARQTN